jgi:hypothetical protein
MRLNGLRLILPALGALLVLFEACEARAQMTPYKALKNWAQTAPLTGSGELNQPLKPTGQGQNLSTIQNQTAPYEETADRKGYRREAEEDGVPDPRAIYANAEHTVNSMTTKSGGEKSAYNKFLTGSDMAGSGGGGSGSFFDDMVGPGGMGLSGGGSYLDQHLSKFLNASGGRGTGGGGMAFSGLKSSGGGGSTMATSGGRANTNATQGATEIFQAQAAAERITEPGINMNQAKANQALKSGTAGSNMGEDAKEQLSDALDGMTQYLLNVANENAAAPIASRAPSKTYANAIWMVQQMFSKCYIPMAILLVLPGAVLTNMKGLVGFQLLHLRDEDTQGPFTGILRAIIAVFLIPATQLFVSYVIDTANALQGTVAPEANVSLIFTWAQEQVQTFGPNQQGRPVMNMPITARASYRGKFAGMPTRLAMMEQMSYTDLNLTEITNEILALLSQGISIISAFQLVFMAYLFLLGPISAAFFAWPGVGRDLFRKAFASWMDGVVILALWKFWWDVVLVCMTVWLEQGGVNPYDPVNVYYLLAFESLLMFVPFSPFDFKPGEIVTSVLGRAEMQAEKVMSKGPKNKGPAMV